MSTIYYALFATLSKSCADLLVGKPVTGEPTAWLQVYRCLEHRTVYSRCGEKKTMASFDPRIQDFANHLRLMQHYRLLADYSYGFDVRLATVTDYLATAELAITQFEECERDQKVGFVVHVAIKAQFHLARDAPHIG